MTRSILRIKFNRYTVSSRNNFRTWKDYFYRNKGNTTTRLFRNVQSTDKTATTSPSIQRRDSHNGKNEQ